MHDQSVLLFQRQQFLALLVSSRAYLIMEEHALRKYVTLYLMRSLAIIP
jgi:hypothetical protein